ncbi:hypothetical protein CY0110_16512 [Crocosphaera chwakensis CCY0110]|uniref:Uncharacterized protein n=1 Tax=Crocosphaera chwakensis CCY0110 TaxID=391612 RepID=A3IHY4_9CHRO|nr:hypothetical protein CY0110_16512 [Crocosphaera chwakensis CCY0110]
MRHNVIGDATRFNMSRPTNHKGNTESPFPTGVFFSSKRSHSSIRPAIHVRPVIGAIDNDGIICESCFV